MIRNDRILTVARYDNSADAHVARNLLVEAGIEAMVANENQHVVVLNMMLGQYVDLQVFESDLPEARELLGLEPASESAAETDPLIECPNCGSGRVARADGLGRIFWSAIALGQLFMATPFPHHRRRRYRCTDCGKKFMSYPAPLSQENA